MLIAGNWKMFKGPREAQAFFDGFDAPADHPGILLQLLVEADAATR